MSKKDERAARETGITEICLEESGDFFEGAGTTAKSTILIVINISLY